MTSEQSLEQLLTTPSASAAWAVRGGLLELGHTPTARPLQILGDYYQFLVSLEHATSAITYTRLAYWLSAGAAFVSFISDKLDQLNPLAIFSNLLPKGIDEGLDILAAGNYTNSAETAIPTLTHHAAWQLYTHFWELSLANQPTLSPSARRQLLEQTFQQFHAEKRPLAQTIIIGRLFQYALLLSLNTNQRAAS